MVLPLYLARTAAEIPSFFPSRFPCAYMACQFSPYTAGLSCIPDSLPENSVLILNDRMPCQGHSADLVAGQLARAAEQLNCESVLLDFQRPPEPESLTMVNIIVQSLPCPVAVSQQFAKDLSCPVFLSPAPLHLPLEQHLAPWQGREIWLETALNQEDVVVTNVGSEFISHFPVDGLSGGFYDECLHCNYRVKVETDRITFTLFDTQESLQKKLAFAHALGVSRAVGLYQELGCIL